MTRFPDNRGFAFTIFDDTDFSTVENTAPVYRFLADLGLRTTKSVWPLSAVSQAPIGGGTLQERDYRQFVTELKEEGFEIALHNVRNWDAPRATVVEGLETFRSMLGDYPRTHGNHAQNRDNLYWGPQRLSAATFRLGYYVADVLRSHVRFEGHVPGSDFFWADLCREHISYVRNFVFRKTNLDAVNPTLPYHDPSRPWVNFWFSSCEGANVDSFCEAISEPNQERLEAEGGVCIMYTHLSQGFCNGELHPRFVSLMRRLAAKNGWFVPVATLLDHLRTQRAESNISRRELAAMERRWVMEKLHTGTS